MLEILVMALLIVAALQAAILYKLFGAVQELIAVNKKLNNPTPAENDLRTGDIEALVERCLNDISEQPRDPRPRWYLARAYYKKQMWADAREQFETLAELEPSWKSDSIDPYIRAIEDQMASDHSNQ